MVPENNMYAVGRMLKKHLNLFNRGFYHEFKSKYDLTYETIEHTYYVRVYAKWFVYYRVRKEVTKIKRIPKSA